MTDAQTQDDVLDANLGDSSTPPENSAVSGQDSEFRATVRATLDRLGLDVKRGAQYYGVPVTTLSNWINRSDGGGISHPAKRLVAVMAMVETLAPDIHVHFIPGVRS